MSKQNRNLLVILGAAALSLCLWCALFAGAMSLSTLIRRDRTVNEPSGTAKVVTRVVSPTRATLAPATRTPTTEATSSATAAPTALATVDKLPSATAAAPGATPDASGESPVMNPAEAEMPQRDLRDLALRLKGGVAEIPEVVNATPPSFNLGDTAEFWVSNEDTQEHTLITAELRYITPHLYMWVEQGVGLDQKDLEASAERFESDTYPTNREFFGSEWMPGVDNDPHLSILHARDLGGSVAGYYSSADEFSRLVNPYSNEREMFYISAARGMAGPNTSFYDGTLAHEFQHMIHWANDRNEDSWVNEGMSELAGFLNGYDPGNADVTFSLQPDTQLNTWSDLTEGNFEHYGASYLFTSYFLDRFGEDLTKAVVASPLNGIAGFDQALETAGRTERFDDVFADWVVANFLDNPAAGPGGIYGYSEIDPMQPAVVETHRRLPAEEEMQVGQYATDYIKLRRDGDVSITFEGQPDNKLVDAELMGSSSWWSNRGDDSDARLTRAFDLRDVDKATLNFSTWYDIEEGWDYAYVAVSTDGGEKWKVLPGKHTTEENPVGNAFGVGWSGKSGGGKEPVWIEEQVDLTPFAGKEILLRFEYVTDDAVNEPGFLLDNLAIPEIGYADDIEGGVAGWDAEGWLLTDNQLEQRWLVQLIRANGDDVQVLPLEVGADGRGQLTVKGLSRNETVVLAVSGLTRFTTEPAIYRYALAEP